MSFLDNIAVYSKIFALIFSSALLVLNGAYNVLNYKNAHIQRTHTLVRLMSLRRKFIIHEANMSIEELEFYLEQLESIMRDDIALWHDNLPKDKD